MSFSQPVNMETAKASCVLHVVHTDKGASQNQKPTCHNSIITGTTHIELHIFFVELDYHNP